MDLVLLDHFDADGLKGAESDVQGDFGDLDAAGADAVENFGREVQSGGWRGDRAERPGVHGLVLLAVERRVGAIDVGRKRDVSDALEHGEEVGDRIEAQMALAELAASDDLGGEFVRLLGGVEAEVDAFADAQLASGMNESLPHIGFGRESGG